MTCNPAAKAGCVDMLQWIRAQDPPCPWSQQTSNAAARAGHLHVLQWLLQQEPPCPVGGGACTAAAKHGHLEVLELLDSSNVLQPAMVYGAATCTSAVSGGQLTVLQWLSSRGVEWGNAFCQELLLKAKELGQQKAFEWVQAQQGRFLKSTGSWCMGCMCSRVDHDPTACGRPGLLAFVSMVLL